MIKSNYSIRLDKEIDSIYTAKNNEILEIETINAYGDNVQNISELMDLISGKYGDKHHHPLTGPIDIDGAEPGDVLKVDILDIKIDVAAQSLSKSAGMTPIEINKFSVRAPIIANYNKDLNKVKYINGMYIPYRPMLGIIGTAPEKGFIKTGHAGKTGGNLDIPFITEGVSVYLPIETKGGKLFIGDAHASQGYGELGGIALEASAKVRLRVSLLKPRKVFNSIVIIGKEPLTNKKALGVVGVANSFQNLNEAVYNSYVNMIEVLHQLIPTINKNYICNIITAIGHSMNGQAFSKTSESTSIINILKNDLKILKENSGISLKDDFEQIMFK